jgi:hypothetical protein
MVLDAAVLNVIFFLSSVGECIEINPRKRVCDLDPTSTTVLLLSTAAAANPTLHSRFEPDRGQVS